LQGRTARRHEKRKVLEVSAIEVKAAGSVSREDLHPLRAAAGKPAPSVALG
jgi:hypothetical protein